MPARLMYQKTDDSTLSQAVFAPDGRSYAVLGSHFAGAALTDSVVRFFDAQTGKLLATTTASQAMDHVVFNAQGSKAAVSGPDHLLVCDPATGTILWNVPYNGTGLGGIRPAFSPDNRMLYAGSTQELSAFDTRNGDRLWGIPYAGTGNHRLNALALSGDGSKLVAVLGDPLVEEGGAIRCLDGSGNELWVVNRDEGVLAAEFSPDATMVLTRSRQDILTLLDSGGAVIDLLAHPGPEPDGGTQAISPDSTMAAVFLDGGYQLHRIATPPPVLAYRFEVPADLSTEVNFVAFTADSAALLIPKNRTSSRLISTATGEEVVEIPHGGDPAFGFTGTAAVSPDGRFVVTAGQGVIKCFDLVSTEICRLDHDGPVRSARPSPDGRSIATASDDGTARTFDPATGAEMSRLTHGAAVFAVLWSPTQPGRPWFVTVSADGTTRFFEPSTGTEKFRQTQPGRVQALAVDQTGSRVATGGEDAAARVIDAQTGELRFRVQHDDAVLAVAFNAAADRLATGSADSTARLINTLSGVQLLKIVTGGPVRAVAFDPAGTRLAFAGDEPAARVLDPRTGAELFQVPLDSAALTLGFSPDGTLLAFGTESGKVTVVSAADGLARSSFDRGAAVGALTFSPSGALLATAGADRTARTHDPLTGVEKSRHDHDDTVTDVSFTPDGTRLVTASLDGTARVFAL